MSSVKICKDRMWCMQSIGSILASASLPLRDVSRARTIVRASLQDLVEERRSLG